MPEQSLTFSDAAKLLRQTRDDILTGQTGDLLKRVSERGKHIDVGLTTKRDVLVITGSNNWQDYSYYNLRPWRKIPNSPEVVQLTKDIRQQDFHRGFLLHASRILSFLGDDKPQFIVGHSLGAAAAQILGTALNVPTICFASPQVVKRRALKDAKFHAPHTHEQWRVFNVAWKQDFVTKAYRMFGLRSLGHRVELDLHNRNIGIDHFVRHYQELLAEDAKRSKPKLPKSWQDPSVPIPSKLP